MNGHEALCFLSKNKPGVKLVRTRISPYNEGPKVVVAKREGENGIIDVFENGWWQPIIDFEWMFEYGAKYEVFDKKVSPLTEADRLKNAALKHLANDDYFINEINTTDLDDGAYGLHIKFLPNQRTI